MATKAFQGEVIKSEQSSFIPDRGDGSVIVNWKLVIMLTDELTKEFNITDRNVCYNQAKELVKGNEIIIHANAEPGRNERVKWVPIQIEKMGATEKKEPSF